MKTFERKLDKNVEQTEPKRNKKELKFPYNNSNFVERQAKHMFEIQSKKKRSTKTIFMVFNSLPFDVQKRLRLVGCVW